MSATTAATPTSYSAPGTDRRRRCALASAFAAPTQQMMVASCSPCSNAVITASQVISPPSLSPAAQSGNGISGSWTSTWIPCDSLESTACNTIRITMMSNPRRRNAP